MNKIKILATAFIFLAGSLTGVAQASVVTVPATLTDGSYVADGSKGQSLIFSLFSSSYASFAAQLKSAVDISSQGDLKMWTIAYSNFMGKFLSVYAFTGENSTALIELTPHAGSTVDVKPLWLLGNVNVSLQTVSAVPEPSSYSLLALGVIGLVIARRQNKQRYNAGMLFTRA